jgi:phage FluMu gp28-like protein
VGRFGTPRLRLIFDNLLLEDFQQEYECAWVDESTAWITWEEIKRNQRDTNGSCLTASGVGVVGVAQAFAAIDQLALLVVQGHVEQSLAGGMDVGRTRNTTELFFVGRTEFGSLPLRLMITLDNVEFADQQAVLDHALTVLPVTKVLIDRTGLGMQLAEQATARHGIRAEGVTFTNDLKHLWSVELKVQLQKGHVPLPLDRDLTYQLHSIKKTLTPGHHLAFESDPALANRHHADKYWALALAVFAARPDPRVAYWGPAPLPDPRDLY